MRVRARRLPNGNLLVPIRAESGDGSVIGDGMVEVAPGSPEYAAWESKAGTVVAGIVQGIIDVLEAWGDPCDVIDDREVEE